MLNIDSDVEGHFLTSCAGGMHIESKLPVSYEEAKDLLKYDSNKSALWELNEKIKRGLINVI